MSSERSIGSKHQENGARGLDDFNRRARTSWTQRFSVDFVGVFLVFFLTGLERLPAVNEPHYWTKSAHFWDSEYGRGDLFLESANAHALFYATFGLLTRLCSMPTAVWIGRIVVWGMLAWGWTSMMRGVFRTSADRVAGAWVGTLSAGVWCFGMRWGHLAGEWVVGGVEAKVAAYAFVFLGFGFFFSQRWTLGWLCLGLAGAMHVVVGLWVFLGSIFASYWIDRFGFQGLAGQSSGMGTSPVVTSHGERESNGWWLRNGWGIPLALIGLGSGMLPPLMADWGASSWVSTQASMIQVYKRLGHHLAPSAIASVRWQSFGVLLLAALGVIFLCLGNGKRVSGVGGTKKRTGYLASRDWSAWTYGMRFILLQAFFGLAVALVGCWIDWGSALGFWSRESSARVLKYYWFRWNDVVWPLELAVGLVWLAWVSPRGQGLSDRVWARQIVLMVVVFLGIWGLWDRIRTRGSDWLGEGERARLLSKSDGLDEQLVHYEDWIRVCEYVRSKTEPGSLWLTPRNQQTFKWHTQRGEVAAWKDMPQDATSVVEWFERLSECYPVDSERSLEPWTTEKILELHKRYGFRYVLIDRRVGGQSPPLLPMLYPGVLEENSTFAVFEIPQR